VGGLLSNVWIPYALTDAAKTKRVTTCEHLLQQYHRNNFLHRLITADESWVYWQNSCRQRHKSWRCAGDQPVTESKTILTNKKFMLSLFWDSKGIILMDVLPPGETITAKYYCDLLEKLNAAVFEKREDEYLMATSISSTTMRGPIRLSSRRRRLNSFV
jgi:hypothetical protein